MKKKMILGSIGAIVIVLLMTSSATAVLQHIDTNIKITKKYEQKLTDAYNNIDDADFKTLLGGIIDLLKTKKVVNSGDIQKIIEDNNLAVSGVYFSRSISADSAGCCGPHIIRLYWGMFLYWIADRSYFPEYPSGINVRVGPDTYNYAHKGLAVSYFGVGLNGAGFGNGHPQCDFTLAGFGFLIFVS